MPELPEVETIAVYLRRRLIGARIARVQIVRPDYMRAGGESMAGFLPGKRVERIDRHGKQMTCVLNPAGRLAIHLGMSGRVLLEPVGAPLASHTHLTICFEGLDVELRIRDPRRFGGVWLLTDAAHSAIETGSGLGPDALSIQRRQLRAILSRRRQIKALLMDQHMISGLGNIYCDEALFRAGIHPLRRADTLDDAAVERLWHGIRNTLRSALVHGGSTFREYRQADGSPGSFQKRHRVYGRAGLPCRRCGRSIRRFQAAGRTTHACVACQPVPRGKARRQGEGKARGHKRIAQSGAA
jgi:formamidopyrimidine-DNA glycosylase